MSPQFVDFNSDGKIDIVAGTFDGSPHVALGGEKGFDQPVQILDASGQRIVLNRFWNFDTKIWDSTKRADLDGATEGHATSAIAFDWDGDGDFDLLLGDHKTGHVYLRTNDGTNAKPAFATKNVPVRAGNGLIDVPGTVATVRAVDWNGDGLQDLLVSSMGSGMSEAGRSGVYLFVNSGSKQRTSFAAPITLVAPGTHDGIDHPVRPDSGLYADLGDLDGDGDLDLLVGGYSHWTPGKVTLTPEQAKRAEELRSELKDCASAQDKLNEALEKAVGKAEGEEAAKLSQEFFERHKSEIRANGEKRQALQQELEPLEAGPKRLPFVWFYENVSAKTARDAGAR
ncbi:MAG: VCBS repeat-containing protein [Planctomycetes bacterium]|nr:VCBS repeat-containing protein [Planctomycetota bacterium]